ncbi:MAG: hypothetical protein K2K05_03300 [Muribaculaceae bacterium]|nr:hypothetical protein [Muribaculaceae bacterium]
MTTRTRIIIMMLTVVLAANAGTAAATSVAFRSDMLQKMAELLHATDRIASLSDGEHFITDVKGRKVNVRIADGEVQHIGYQLFDPSLKNRLNRSLTDYVERYWLSLTLPMDPLRSADARMREDHFYFIAGNVASVDRVQRDTTLMVNFSHTDKMLDIEWAGETGEICHVVSPVTHELIFGRNMLENDRRLADEIRRACADSIPVHRYTADMLVHSDSTSLLVCPGGFYYLDELRADRYFFPADSGSVALPVWSDQFPCQSIANMFSGLDIPVAADIPLHIRHVAYGRIDEFDISVRQFVAFALDQGCTPYVGIVGMADGQADVLVMMCNMQLGYNHLLRLRIGTDGLSAGAVSANGRLNAYIPTANLKNLFKEDDNDSPQ